MQTFQRLLLTTSVSVGLALAGGSAFAADLMAPAAVTTGGGGYVSVFAGAALPHAVRGDYTNAATTTGADIPVGAGYILGAAIGTDLMPNLRGELELSYASHGVTGTYITRFPNGSTSTATDAGSFNTLYLLGNIWYDFDTSSKFTPYVGGGLGAALMMPNVSFPNYPGSPSFSTSSGAVAGQLGAGVKFQIADNMSLDLGYRIKGVFGGGLTQTNYPNNLKNVSYFDQSVQIGLTVGF